MKIFNQQEPSTSHLQAFVSITYVLTLTSPQMYYTANLSSLPFGIAGQVLDSPKNQVVSDQGEDCLTITVQRPSTATPNSKLPVIFWIFGGGFEFGST
jgi:acetylcholinesterase